MAIPPAVTWAVSGGGTIDAGGLFTAGATTGGPHTVTASSGGVSDTASVTVVSQPPTIASAASANPNPVTATTTAVSGLGADDGREAGLTYTWSSTGPAPLAFNVNGTNAAKNATATFAAAGSYVITLTITDGQGPTA